MGRTATTEYPAMTPLHPPVTIRAVCGADEFAAVEQVQRRVWEMPDWREAVPANLLITIQKNGGLVLGAYAGDQLIGFALGFLGAESALGQTKIKHASHMLAVLPEYRARGIGVRLKLAQRDAARAQGLDLMTWTYDPLQALNATLNLWRLGAIARRYLPDAYGEMNDGLNAGMPSDRFEVEWRLNAPRVVARAQAEPPKADWDALARAGAREIFRVVVDAAQLPRIEFVNEIDGDTLLVEIPARLGQIKSAALACAREWRAHTRDIFQRAFAAGYRADNFVWAERAGIPRAAYVLRKEIESLE